jgi:hypothetical protein
MKGNEQVLLERRIERAIKSRDLVRIEKVAASGLGKISSECLGHGVISAAMNGYLSVVEYLVRGLKANARFADDSALRWAAVLKRDEVTKFLAQRVLSLRRWKRLGPEKVRAEVEIVRGRISRSCPELKKPPEVEKRAMEIVEREAVRLIEKLSGI